MNNKNNTIEISKKIKVFISSKCDGPEETPKYNPIRSNLKKIIENTGLAEVYVFEGEEASSLSAGNNYTFALEDSDICIFLIDNYDGIPTGVQNEIDIVQRNNIKALYYFCDENQKEKTALEKNLMGASFAKSKTVHKFSDLSKNGAVALINDIISIYHYYCIGKLEVINDHISNELQDIDITTISKFHENSLPKSVVKNIDKCADYILKNAAGISLSHLVSKSIKTSELDDWGIQFLPILFEGKSIKEFNTALFLECLKSIQEEEYFKIVSLRWNSIQAYFSGYIEKCIEYLKKALKTAKETNQPSWVIKDILIDLRNQEYEFCTIVNKSPESYAQKELDASEEELYYPVIDRNNETLHEKYIRGLYKKKTESPYSVTLGSNLDQYGKLLASIFIVALYNGSLTHILLFYEKIKDFLFYLTSCYSDWNFKRDLMKYAIKTYKSKEVSGIQNAYPEVLGRLNKKDAETIMFFCSQHPIYHKRFQMQLLAFGSVGYYLDDKVFQLYESQIVEMISSWLDDKQSTILIGNCIFNNLSNIYYRLDQNTIAEICCKFIDKHYRRWYRDMFKFMSKSIDINKMSEENAIKFINHIIEVLKNDNEREQITFSPTFLCLLRKQNKHLTEELDKAIEKYLPDYYENDYKLETSNKENDSIAFIEKYLESIKENNKNQGKNGMYFGYSSRKILIIRSILILNNPHISDELFDSIIRIISDTIIESKESILTKIDAVALLCCIIARYPKAYERNKEIYLNIYNRENEIFFDDDFPFSSNINSMALKIVLKILFTIMDLDVDTDLLEMLPYLKDSRATTITVSNFIASYLELSEEIMFSENIENIILYNVLSWLQDNYINIRFNAVRIMMALLRNSKNHDVINRQIISLIDTDNVYIKNFILRRICNTYGIDDNTKNYVLETCANDANFVTRMIYKEIKQ